MKSSIEKEQRQRHIENNGIILYYLFFSNWFEWFGYMMLILILIVFINAMII